MPIWRELEPAARVRPAIDGQAVRGGGGSRAARARLRAEDHHAGVRVGGAVRAQGEAGDLAGFGPVSLRDVAFVDVVQVEVAVRGEVRIDGDPDQAAVPEVVDPRRDGEDRRRLEAAAGDQSDDPLLLRHQDPAVRQEGERGREVEAAGDDVVQEVVRHVRGGLRHKGAAAAGARRWQRAAPDAAGLLLAGLRLGSGQRGGLWPRAGRAGEAGRDEGCRHRAAVWCADAVHPALPVVELVGRVVFEGDAPSDERLQLGAGGVAARRAERWRVHAEHPDAGSPGVDQHLEGVTVDDADEA